ncbi:hypothetical protein ABZ802_31295 [Streptomyces sp. NPDC047737]|uniref:hypothetical protein n=1 Tax=Streptomyces sp. NPDC047737 TaxID=3155740 RepID=UPI0033F63EE1
MAIDYGQMLVQIERRLAKVEAQSRLSSAALDDTALQVKDGNGVLRGILGQQGDGTTAVNIVNGGPPPAPATPTAAPALGGVSVGWDGTFANGAIIPMDWARVEVHASPTAAFTATADTLQATIETAQGGIVYIPSATPLYVQLLARNTSGAASPATAEVGPYAPKPVAGEIGIGEITETLIADNAVTTPKVFANAVTTAKLAAGSVDAVALKADAITGKTITGGVINGAEFHSDDGAGGLVDIENGTVVATGANGWKFSILPNDTVPAVGFNDSTGQPAGAVFGSGNDALPNLGIMSGTFNDPVVGNSRWLTTVGTTAAGNRVWTRRVNSSTLLQVAGGEAMIDDDASRIAYIDPADSTRNTYLSLYANLADLFNARLVIAPPATASPALHLNAPTAQTGALTRLQLNGADRFVVSPAGAVTVAGALSAASASVTGVLAAGSIASGTVAITPSAANTPTSVSVSGLSVQGNSFRAFVSIANPAPGSTTSNNGVTGVGFSNLTSSGLTIWATRQNTTALTVHWMVMGVTI